VIVVEVLDEERPGCRREMRGGGGEILKGFSKKKGKKTKGGFSVWAGGGEKGGAL